MAMADPSHHLSTESPAGNGRWRAASSGFIAAFVSGVVVVALSWVALIAGQLGKAHPDNVWVKEAYDLKFAAAERLRGQRKVLAVGGSATMFGVDSQQLALGLGLPVVNLGVNAGIGSYEVPAQADRWIAAGDVVVMPLEYRLMLWDGVPSYVTLSWALEHPEALARWHLKTWLWGLMSLPLERVMQGYGGFDSQILPKGPYGAHKLNAFGDQMQSGERYRSDPQRQALIDQPPERYDELYAQSEVGLAEWQHWWAQWQSRGACVVVVPPPFMAVPAYRTEAYTAFFDAIPSRVRARGVPYLGHPSDGFFPVEAMFDTNYHLTAESRATYTQWLTEALRASDLNCFPERNQGGVLRPPSGG